MLARKLTSRMKVIAMTYVMTVIGFLVFNLTAVGQHLTEGTLSLRLFSAVCKPGVPALDSLFGRTLLAHFSLLSNYALSKLAASKVSVFNHLATLVSIVGGFIFLNEQLAYYHMIGAAVIITGVLGRMRGHGEGRKRRFLPRYLIK